MNAEQLHSIAIQVIDDIEAINVIELFAQFMNNLDQLSNNPGDAGAQQNVATSQENLVQGLVDLEQCGWPAGLRQTVIELGGDFLVDDDVKSIVANVLRANAITPAMARDEIKNLHNNYSGFIGKLNALKNSFGDLGIEEAKLEPGEVELGVLVPRIEIDNKLDRFGAEVAELDQIFKYFSVVASGTREDFEVTYISSSDLKLFIRPSLKTAALVAATVSFILGSLNEIADLKLKYDKLIADDNVPEIALAGFLEEIETRLKKDTEENIKNLIKEYSADKEAHDQNEDAARLKIAIDHIAPRLERGYAIEIRVGELPPPEKSDDEDENDAAPDENRLIVEQLKNESHQIRAARPIGKPVLNLPKPGTLEDVDPNDAD